MSTGSDDELPQADEQMAAATRKLRHLVWPPARTIDLTATDDETIDVTEEPEPADAAADPAADPDSVDADSDT